MSPSELELGSCSPPVNVTWGWTDRAEWTTHITSQGLLVIKNYALQFMRAKNVRRKFYDLEEEEEVDSPQLFFRVFLFISYIELENPPVSLGH